MSSIRMGGSGWSGAFRGEAPARIGAGAVASPAAGAHHSWLPAGADAMAAARREIEHLTADVEEDVVERTCLVATELVTNSVRHAGLRPDQAIGMVVSVGADRVRIEVEDEGPGFELPTTEPDPGQMSGWGLWLVDRLVDRWGVDLTPAVRVWCEVDRPGARSAAASRDEDWLQQRRPSTSAVWAFLAEEAGVTSYQRAQREALRGAVEPDGAGPLEFDESGFPIPQRNPGFVARVARLLKP